MSTFFRKKIKYIFFALIAASTVLSCSGCGNNTVSQGEQEVIDAYDDSSRSVFYLNHDGTKVESEELKTLQEADSIEQEIKLYISALSSDPSKSELEATMGTVTNVMDYSLNEGQLILDFDEGYHNLSKSKEILFRASVVKTLCQIDGVESIMFLVESEPVVDSKGNPFGAMAAEDFINNAGNEINSYERTQLTLYFSNAEGTALVPVQETVVYSSNISMEKLVLEKLLEGPGDSGARATLSSDRKIISVTTKDGICYVNLSSTMVDITDFVSEEISLYSIVDSLTELNHVNKVLLSIDGSSDGYFRGAMPLSEPYSRNLDIIEE